MKTKKNITKRERERITGSVTIYLDQLRGKDLTVVLITVDRLCMGLANDLYREVTKRLDK